MIAIGAADVVSLTDPYSSNHGGTMRTRGLVEALHSLGVTTSVLTPSAAIGEQFLGTGNELSAKARLRSRVGAMKRNFLPMPTAFGARDSALKRKVRGSDADLLIISVLSQAPYARLTDAPLWLDFMDVWSAVSAREARNRTGLARLTAAAQSRALARVEARYSRSAKIVTAVGWADAALLQSRGINAVWLPVSLPDDSFAAAAPARSEKVAGLIGNFAYWPNVDAYEALVRNWAAPLRERGWSIVVAGRQSRERLRKVDGIEIIGEVPNVDAFYERISLSLAPIRLGGGIKVKVIESLAKGIPVLGTPFAFEGFPPSLMNSVIQAGLDSPDFEALETVDSLAPTSAQLEPFRHRSAIATISELVNGGLHA